MFKNQKFNYLILGILSLVAVFVWSVVFSQTPTNFLVVHFFDVGQGDAIFMEMPNHQQVLIDGGPDKTVLEKLSQTMPFYDRTIDLIILTHPDNDHLTGLVEVLKYYQVSHILFSGVVKETTTYQQWQNLIKEKNIPLTIVQTGQKIILANGIKMDILWPDQSLIQNFVKNTNNVSVVAKLIYGQTEFLLIGDIEKDIEQLLVNQNWNLESDVLKVAHHGSRNSSSYNFIQAVKPQISIISVGADNSYKHPHAETLERLKKSFIFRTDKSSDIEIKTDGIIFETETGK